MTGSGFFDPSADAPPIGTPVGRPALFALFGEVVFYAAAAAALAVVALGLAIWMLGRARRAGEPWLHPPSIGALAASGVAASAAWIGAPRRADAGLSVYTDTYFGVAMNLSLATIAVALAAAALAQHLAFRAAGRRTPTCWGALQWAAVVLGVVLSFGGLFRIDDWVRAPRRYTEYGMIEADFAFWGLLHQIGAASLALGVLLYLGLFLAAFGRRRGDGATA